MGGLGSGNRGDQSRRRRATELRDGGMAPGEIAERLGVTRQAVHSLLRPPKAPNPRPVLCQSCRARLAEEGGATERRVLCLRCLARRRDATFADRLRACRVAAGLTRLELAERSGVPAGLVARYEISYTEPRASQLQGLAQALGPQLALLLLGLGDETG
jgi:hypothetical protein